jgi:hypothetical protein
MRGAVNAATAAALEKAGTSPLAGYLRGLIEANHPMAALKQSLGHVSAHFSQSDHGEFHKSLSYWSIFSLVIVS